VASRCLPRGFRLDALLAQLRRKGLAPAVQVRLARVQAPAVLRLRTHADVHVRVGLVVVQHHHALVVGQLGLRELACRPLNARRVAAARHRQHDVEGLAPRARVLDQAAAVAPVVDQLAKRILAAHRLAALVLDLESAVLADVAEVRGDRLHAAPAARHLDHHLRRAARGARRSPRCALGSLQRADARPGR
jgi:hypothetical protein